MTLIESILCFIAVALVLLMLIACVDDMEEFRLMNLLIDNGILYCDNLFLCYARPGNARRNYDDGFYAVEIRTDTLNAVPYLFANGLGRIGANPDTDDVVLCRVVGGSATNAYSAAVENLFALVEARSEAGCRVILEINNG